MQFAREQGVSLSDYLRSLVTADLVRRGYLTR
jgi:hypothetical protein